MPAPVLDPRLPEVLEDAARLLRLGGLVAFPTETVYGLGANAFDARAVARIFEAKARPSFDPLIVHLAAASDLEGVAAHVPPLARLLAESFWPGPLTLVLERQPTVPDIVTAGLSTVGVRVPDHELARGLIRAARVPVAAPSANPFGYVSPTSAAHVAEQLGERLELILDGGPCRVGVESTIVSLVDVPTLLRPGGLPLEAIEAALGRSLLVARPTDRPSAPGQLSRHYATRTPLAIRAAQPAGSGRLGLLAHSRATRPAGYVAIEYLSEDGDPQVAAARLFAALRRLDAQGLAGLVAEPWEERGLGRAIMDRLRRCATGSGG